MPKAISCVEEAVFEVEGGVMKLLDACELIVDCPHSTAKDEGSGYPLIRTPNIGKGRLKLEGVHRVSYETYCARNERAVPKTDDLILAREAPVGNVAIIKNGQQVCLGQRTVLIRPNKNIVEPDFLVYYLLAPEMQHMLLSAANGATVSHLNMADIRKLEISLPDLEVQKKIGRLLSTIEDKIETNNEINDNLLQQAEAVFDKYYNASSNQQLFTSLINVLGGGTPKTGNPDFWDGSIPFFTPKDVGAPYTFQTEKYITESGLDHCNSRLYPKNTTFVTARGTVGKVCLAGVPMAMNQSCYALASETIDPLLVYFYVLKTVASLKHKASGAVFDAIVTRDFDIETINILTDEDAQSAVSIIAPIMEAIHNNIEENMRLSKLRDALLPKLMSGELDVSNLDI